MVSIVMMIRYNKLYKNHRECRKNMHNGLEILLIMIMVIICLAITEIIVCIEIEISRIGH